MDASVVLELELGFEGEVEVGFAAPEPPYDSSFFVRDFVERACVSRGDEEVSVGEEVDGIEMASGCVNEGVQHSVSEHTCGERGRLTGCPILCRCDSAPLSAENPRIILSRLSRCDPPRSS